MEAVKLKNEKVSRGAVSLSLSLSLSLSGDVG
jgi:hypothetical protein